MKKIILLSVFSLIGFTTWGQQTFVLHEKSEVVVKGTSTLHEWTGTVGEMEGEASFTDEFLNNAPESQKTAAESVTLKFAVNSIKGGRGDTMDRKIVTAFKGEENPYISFIAEEPSKVTEVKDDGVFVLTSKGELSMAGVSKPIEILLEGKKTEEGNLSLSASQKLNMTDFEMEPPSAMFGQIVTGEEVTVVFDLVLIPATGQ